MQENEAVLADENSWHSTAYKSRSLRHPSFSHPPHAAGRWNKPNQQAVPPETPQSLSDPHDGDFSALSKAVESSYVLYRQRQHHSTFATITMDPASAIIGIASGAVALVAMTAQVITYLVDLRDDSRNTDVILLDLVLTCRAYEAAWTRIQGWLFDKQSSADASESILHEFASFLEGGKVMMKLIRADIHRLSRGSWWRGGRLAGTSAARLLLHKKTVLEHRDRIHAQNTSLHLLLSCCKLPSKPLREAAIDVLRPKFRKDEETAWTIVDSKLSPNRNSKTWPTTLGSSGMSTTESIASVVSYRNLMNKSFDFEDDLFLGPVYKRLLIERLCDSPSSRFRSVSAPQANHDNSMSIAAAVRSDDDGLDQHNDDTLALELRQQGLFSRSCHEDYLEFMGLHRPRKMKRRHLPLASVSREEQQDSESVRERFVKAVGTLDLEGIALALDDGVDVNMLITDRVTAHRFTALEQCFYKRGMDGSKDTNAPSTHMTVAEFLMLYKETHIPYTWDYPPYARGYPNHASILHVCMRIGATAEFMRQFFNVESKVDALSRIDACGDTVLHTAVLCEDIGLFALSEVKKLVGDVEVQANQIYDEEGLSAYGLAKTLGAKARRHLEVLEWLMGSPMERHILDQKLAHKTPPRTGTKASYDGSTHVLRPLSISPGKTEKLSPVNDSTERYIDGARPTRGPASAQPAVQIDEKAELQKVYNKIYPYVAAMEEFSATVLPQENQMTPLQRRWSLSLAHEFDRGDSLYYHPRRNSTSNTVSGSGLLHHPAIPAEQSRSAATHTFPPAGLEDFPQYRSEIADQRLQLARMCGKSGMRLFVANPDMVESQHAC